MHLNLDIVISEEHAASLFEAEPASILRNEAVRFSETLISDYEYTMR